MIEFPAGDSIFTQSQWKIVKKLKEKCTQEDEEDWELFDHISSQAIAMFECVDLDTNESAFMKIYIQFVLPSICRIYHHLTPECLRIPYAGSEIYLPEETAQQAVPDAEINEHIALLTMKCKSTPTLIAWKREIQDDLGFVPGGYIVYLVTKKMPGIRLSLDTFWELSRDQRDEIRAAFKVAWLYVASCFSFEAMGSLLTQLSLFFNQGISRDVVLRISSVI